MHLIKADHADDNQLIGGDVLGQGVAGGTAGDHPFTSVVLLAAEVPVEDLVATAEVRAVPSRTSRVLPAKADAVIAVGRLKETKLGGCCSGGGGDSTALLLLGDNA